MNAVPASIPALRWAAERARLLDGDLERSFRKWALWLSEDAQPTLKQLEDFARLTRTPIGYFFLPEPPVLQLPVPDFRTLRDEELAEPSTALLDTLYLCQQRQDWYRDYSRVQGLAPLDFVSSATLEDQPEQAAGAMRQILGLSVAERRALPTWTDALRQLISRAEDAGILVMISSIVGSNSRRKLDVAEFRGFALVDDRAPLIFINGSDSKAAQMFTLAHELSHIWLGESGISNPEVGSIPRQGVKGWCNRAAAELLMPLDALHEVYEFDAPLTDEVQRLAHLFKVSSLVALRRLYDAGFIDRDTLWLNYRQETARIRALDRGGSGGNFYRTLSARTGKRFASAVLASTLEGQTLFRDAFRMLGMRKTSTLYEAARELGVMR
ncbi:MAG: ImmA/IrrE family metallo-endopeptidase [Aminivibrio sp.]|jgi:Zn-dependent peptidase ImmA (M78 family)